MCGMFATRCLARSVTFAGSASGAGGAALPHATSASSAALCRDDRAGILALESGEHLARLQAVDDLQLLAPAGAWQVIDDDALDNQIVEVARDQLLRGDARDEL